MSTKKNKPRDSSGKTGKDGNSHHDFRPQSGTTARQRSSTKEKKNENEAAPIVSPNAKSDARAKTARSRGNSTIAQQSRPKSADTRLARGILKGENPVDVSIKVLECDTKKGALENEKAEWKKEKAELQKWLEEEKQNVKETNNKMKEIKEKSENECERLREIMKELKQSLSKEKEDNKTLQKNCDQLEQDLERECNQSKTKWDKYCKKLTEKHANEKEQLLNTIESLTAEKEKLQTRLSTIAADRLMDGNVNIADLSDADRPSKLQEVYSELYDNEWTDAFEELTNNQKIPEKDAIMILLKILMSSFQNCREITWGRYERLRNVASSIDIEQRNSLSSAKKVMSNVSKQSLSTQEAESSRAQLDKNDKKEDQKSAMDKNLDTLQEGTASSEGAEKKGMQVVSEERCIVTGGEENMESCDPNVRGASKDKSENVNGKTGGEENMESCDPNVRGASKDKSENVNGKTGGEENVESCDPNVRGASKDKSENVNGKNGAKENMEFGITNVSGASKDKSENEKEKNGAKESVESGDTNMSGASKDKSENEKGKCSKCTIDLNFDLMQGIKGIWRKTTLELKGISEEPICKVIETSLDIPVSAMPMISKYLKRCVDLCWKMGVQEKPLHLDSIAEMDAYAGKKFDKDKFRAYTQSGRNVAFVVWPTLYLYEGGPMLVKGIAQGCSSDEKHKTKMHS